MNVKRILKKMFISTIIVTLFLYVGGAMMDNLNVNFKNNVALNFDLKVYADDNVSMNNVKYVSAGEYSSLVLKNDGTVWACGQGAMADFGDNKPPTEVRTIYGQVLTGVSQIACGDGSGSLAVKTDGTLWCSARDYSDNLTGQDKTVWIKSDLTNVAQVACGECNCLALKKDGTLWVYGNSGHGELGIGDAVSANKWTQVLTGVSQISASSTHSLALKKDGTVWGCGEGGFSEFGDNTCAWKRTWTQVFTGAKQVTAGCGYSMVLKPDGTVWGAGEDEAGELGDGVNTDGPDRNGRPYWTQIATNVSSLSSGGNWGCISFIIKNDNTLWGCCYNKTGALGDGTNTNKLYWTQVLTNVSQVCSCNNNSYVVKTDGTLWATGDNTYGQLGDGTTTGRNVWKQVLTGVVLDLTPPTLTVAPNTTAPTNGKVIMTATASDSGTGVASIILPDNSIVNGSSANYTVTTNGTYTFKCTDNYGNVTSQTITVSNIDTTPPTAPSVNVAGNKLTITAGKDNGSGVKETDYQLNGGYWTKYAAPVTLPYGSYSVNAKTIDNVGNVSTVTTTTCTINDNISPTLRLTPSTSAPTNGNVVITAAASDSESGVASITMPDGTNVSSSTATYTANANGTYTFKCTDKSGNTVTQSITVNNIDKTPPTAPSINVNGNQLTIAAGKDDGSGVKETDYQLNNGAWNKYNVPVTLSGSSYTIKARTIDNAGNVSDIATISTKLTGISLSKTSDELKIGQTDILTAVVTPDNAVNKTVKWTSSDSSVVAVDQNGKVTALKAGTAVITAATTDGSNLAVSCDVIVKESIGVTLSKDTDNLAVGETDKLQATVTSDNDNKTVKWTSSDTSVATVDQDGNVTAVKAGTAKITATTQDGNNLSAFCTINVENVTMKLILNMTNGTLRQYKISESQFNDFLEWYNARGNNQTSQAYYVFNIPATDLTPASKEYVFFTNIESFKEEDL